MKRIFTYFVLCFIAVGTGCAAPLTPASTAATVSSVFTVHGRVLGTEYADTVAVRGDPTQSGAYLSNIRIEITDRSGDVTILRPHCDGGYRPRVFLADFENTGYPQIFYTADSGGSGGYEYSYVFDASTKRVLFDWERDSRNSDYRAEFADDKKAIVSGGEGDYWIDLSRRDAQYLSELYDANGKLLRPISAQAYPICYTAPLYDPASERWQLMTVREICGVCHADKLAYLTARLVCNNGIFRPFLVTAKYSPSQTDPL